MYLTSDADGCGVDALAAGARQSKRIVDGM